MRSDELHEMIDQLEYEKESLEESFNAIRKSVLAGRHLSEKDCERLCELKDETAYLLQDIDYRLFRCDDECSPIEIADEKKRLDQLRRNIEKLNETISKQMQDIETAATAKKTVKKDSAKKFRHFVVSQSRRTIKKGWTTGKGAVSRIDPFNKPVNQNDTADHSAESIRLAKQTVRKAEGTVKTVKTTIQTTRKSIALAKDTAKTTYTAAKTTAVTTYKVTRATVRGVYALVVHLIAAVTSPVVWIICIAGIIVYILISSIIILLSGAEYKENVDQDTVINPAGLYDDIPQDIQDALSYYRIACENQKAEFCNMINGFYYDINNLRESDLVFMVRNVPLTTWQTSFATNQRKMQLCNAWSVLLLEPDALAIVYVDLERQANAAEGTNAVIYPVAFEQAQFDALLDRCAVHTDTVYHGQECPSANCSLHFDEHPNPEYENAYNSYVNAVNRYNDWLAMVVPRANEYRNMLNAYNAAPPPAQSAMLPALNAALDRLVEAIHNWESVFGNRGWTIDENIGDNALAWLGAEVDAARVYMNSVPETIRTPYYTCDHLHDLHSVGLNVYNVNEVMNIYGFTDAEKEWQHNIAQSFAAYLAYLNGP